MHSSDDMLTGCCLVALPICDLFRAYMVNLCAKSHQEQRQQFLDRKRQLILSRCIIGTKLANQVIMIFCTLLHILLIVVFCCIHYFRTLKNQIVVATTLHLAMLLVWLQYIFLILYDSVNYGQTTVNTRITFVVGLLSQTTICILIYSKDFKDVICTLLAFSQTSFLLLSTLFVFSFPRDYVIKNVLFSEYSFKQKLLQDTSVDSQPNKKKRSSKTETVGNDSLVSFGQTNSPKFNIIEDNQIKDIQIFTFKEQQKYQKRTIIYQIEYKLDGHNRKVFRSFREFLSFHSDLKQSCPTQVLPLFPSKRGQNKYLSMDDIKQRQELLDNFLKGILVRFNQNTYLREFLNTSNDTPQYKQKHPTPPSKRISKLQSIQRTHSQKQSHHPNASIPETIWEGNVEEDEESLKDVRKQKRQMKIQDRMTSVHVVNDNNVYSSPSLKTSKTYDEFDTGFLREDKSPLISSLSPQLQIE